MIAAARILLAAGLAAAGIRLVRLAARILPGAAAAPAPVTAAAPQAPRHPLGYEVLADRPYAPFQPGAITLGIWLRQVARLPEARS